VSASGAVRNDPETVQAKLGCETVKKGGMGEKDEKNGTQWNVDEKGVGKG